MDKLLVISSYPKKLSVHGNSTVGVASYAKNTLIGIKRAASNKINITVLAEKLPDDISHTHIGITVRRVWERNSFMTFPKLVKEIASNYKDHKTVVIEFELSMFGGILHLLPLPLFLIILRLMRKKIVFINHQVIPNINEIGPHINISDHSFTSISMNFGLRLFYTSILALSSKIIVFEDVLKSRFAAFGNTRKIKVIPHGVESFNKLPTKSQSRKTLSIPKSEFVIVCFGYIAWYKGTDWLINAMSEFQKNTRGKKIKLIVAGGPNPYHMNKNYYSNYIENLSREAKKNGVTITGFVPQSSIPLYYQAADVIILPYRTFMSASGPLSIAFSFKKPFLLALPLKGVLSQSDIHNLMGDLRISQNSLLFKPTTQDFKRVLFNLKNKKQLTKKIQLLSSRLSQMRNWDVVGARYYEELIN